MSSHGPAKRPKIEQEAAVTVLTVLPGGADTTLFSGHRDGTIVRWDIVENDDPATRDMAPSLTWVIAAAPDCTPLYGTTEEQLGIAGLVVRKLPPLRNEDDDDAWQLYSWNHQREDMRDSNGIPQKVMIWNCRDGARCSALMVDVGRCDTGLFANPLVSCLVFCPLRVDDPPPSAPGTVATEGAPKPETTIWVDAIVVGLQATCEAPPAGAPGPPHPPGNIVPFDERTRRRLPPWSAPGGFVRALLVVRTDACLVSVTETVGSRRRRKPSPMEEATAPEGVSHSPGGPPAEKEDCGGQLHEITVWDCHCCGSVLYVVSLRDMAASLTREKTFSGRYLRAVSAWRDQMFLTISSSTTTSTTNGTSIVVVEVKRKTAPEVGCSFAVLGQSHPLSDVCAASSHTSHWIALGESSQGTRPGVKLYDFRDFAKGMGEEDGDPGAKFDLRPMERAGISAPSTGAPPRDPSVLSIGATHVLVGYSNGTLWLAPIPGVTAHPLFPAVDHASVSCSTAPVGLRGVLCPHLSSDANHVHLKNQCVVV
jgi:hypothetical protein